MSETYVDVKLTPSQLMLVVGMVHASLERGVSSDLLRGDMEAFYDHLVEYLTTTSSEASEEEASNDEDSSSVEEKNSDDEDENEETEEEASEEDEEEDDYRSISMDNFVSLPWFTTVNKKRFSFKCYRRERRSDVLSLEDTSGNCYVIKQLSISCPDLDSLEMEALIEEDDEGRTDLFLEIPRAKNSKFLKAIEDIMEFDATYSIRP